MRPPSSAQMSPEIQEIRSYCSSSGDCTLPGRIEKPCCAYVTSNSGSPTSVLYLNNQKAHPAMNIDNLHSPISGFSENGSGALGSNIKGWKVAAHKACLRSLVFLEPFNMKKLVSSFHSVVS